MSATLFILSPANCSGIRAKQLISPRAQFPAAQQYRSTEGVPLCDAFAFMSALYFRGKIAYAKRFAVPVPDRVPEAILLIAPGFGLVTPDWALTPERMKKLQRTPVDVRNRGYRLPVERDARSVAGQLREGDRIVLLGSIATGKYVDLLRPIFQNRLLFPISFVGLGDMSRGAIMLRAAASGDELQYSTLDVERHRKREP
ncbi:MAG TPA: hypothetical protein VNM92_04505 [Thermoanaerobaculia bacterium]|nr:hypothetical protein [Thermoanaerobaculia bacterium]